MAEKMRVHILAKELNVTSKAMITKCQAEGLPVKNHMTALGPGLEATIREWFTEGQSTTAVETAERVDLEKVRVKPHRRTKAVKEKEAEQAATAAAAPAEAPPTSEEAVAAEPGVEQVAAAEAPVAEPSVEPAVESPPTAEPVQAPSTAEPAIAPAPDEAAPAELQEVAQAEPAPMAAEAPSAAPPEAAETEEPAEPLKPAGPQHVPRPAKLQGPRVVRYEAPETDVYPPPRPRGRPRQDANKELGPEPVGPPSERGVRRDGGAATPARRRGVSYTPRRTTRRSEYQRSQEQLSEWRDRDLAERRERLAGATGRKIHTRRAVEAQSGQGPGVVDRKGLVQLHEPIYVKDFCAAVGIPFIKVLYTLQRDHGMTVNINAILPNDIAELLAIEEGLDVEILKAKTQLDQLREEFDSRPMGRPASRPPVVTFLGHVDHGKTTLLDAIRRTHVAVGEDGGITQHISSYHVKTEKISVTFVDTPGHAAFTAMRARGAQVTDVVVLIVACDDGVMPQTVEAINHAKAAQVPIVVAITKIDLGLYDRNKIFGQLTEHGLTPSGDWGGDIDVFFTSGVTGEGIDSLLEHLTALGELLDFKADPKADPTGTVIDSETREGVGPVARVLVQNGTLKRGATIVCGNAYGKVRALINDQGKRMSSAGPSIPCEIWGLDEAPAAGDRFYGLASLQRAKTIAEEVRAQRSAQARIQVQKARTLEEVFEQRGTEGIPELNVILRADVDGSTDALKHTLDQLPGDQVRLVIRHAGLGAVTDGDVQLAQASGAIIVAFRVTPVSTTRKLAEELGVEIREYKVIYDVVDDIVQAMEGLLAPERKVESRASAQVRDVFRISKVGLVAGCYVDDGVFKRDHLVRVVRGGVIVRDNCQIGSLKRFKDDVKEVRAGMECGLRLEGFDDIKTGDVLETYEIVEISRKLQPA